MTMPVYKRINRAVSANQTCIQKLLNESGVFSNALDMEAIKSMQETNGILTILASSYKRMETDDDDQS